MWAENFVEFDIALFCNILSLTYLSPEVPRIYCVDILCMSLPY